MVIRIFMDSDPERKVLQKSFLEKEELILSNLHFSSNTKSINGLQWWVLLIYNKQNYFERDFKQDVYKIQPKGFVRNTRMT